MDGFEDIIGYKFKNAALLATALTHSSYSHENGKKEANNERLEFLGDAVLELMISDYLYNNYPDLSEGELTKYRASIVCEATLAKTARSLGLGGQLMLGRGEDMSGGRKRDSILSDALEALIGAVYLDGGTDEAARFTIQILSQEITRLQNSFRYKDSKTHLQEIIQQHSKHSISYIVIDEKGPDHNKSFTVHAVHDNRVLGIGIGKSKKEAEQNAAIDAVNKIDK